MGCDHNVLCAGVHFWSVHVLCAHCDHRVLYARCHHQVIIMSFVHAVKFFFSFQA